MNILYSFFPVSWRPVWYVSCYIMFLCFVPFLNIAIQNLTKENKRSAIFVSVPIYGIGTLTPLLFNYSREFPAFYSELLCYIAIYVFIQAYKEEIKRCPYKVWIGIFVLNTLILFIGRYHRVMYRESGGGIAQFVGYFYSHLETVVCLVYALSILMLVLNITYYNMWINKISKATVIVYIIHQMPMFYDHLWNDIFRLNYLVDKGPVNIVWVLLFMAMILYVVSYVIDTVIGKGLSILKNMIHKIGLEDQNGII